jgi:hypothetical protein
MFPKNKITTGNTYRPKSVSSLLIRFKAIVRSVVEKDCVDGG